MGSSTSCTILLEIIASINAQCDKYDMIKFQENYDVTILHHVKVEIKIKPRNTWEQLF